MNLATVLLVVVLALGAPVALVLAIVYGLRQRAEDREIAAAQRRARLREARERASKLGAGWLAHQRGRGLGAVVRPYYERGGVVLYHGDWQGHATVGPDDVVVTDPPYGTGGWRRGTSGAGSDPKNVRVAGGAGAVICTVIALGVYQPEGAEAATLTTFVAACAGGAVAAVLARFATKKKDEPKA